MERDNSCCTSALTCPDILGERFSLRLDQRKFLLRSICGACCSLVFMVTVLAYSVWKVSIMVQRKDTTIITTESVLHFGEDDYFDSKRGFNVAVGFTAFDNEQEWSLDPAYGELVFNARYWGVG